MPDVFDAKRNRKSKVTHVTPVTDDQGIVETDATEIQPVDQPVVATQESYRENTPQFNAPAFTRPVEEFSELMCNSAPTRNPLHSFAPKPTNTFYDSKDNQERVLLLLRQHPVTQIKWVVIAILLTLVPFLLSYVNVLGFLPLRFHFVALIAWYLMVVGYTLESFLSWFFNLYIITDERIIDVDFKSLLFRNVSFAKYENVEDVSFTTSGTLGAIFDYGTVLVQTAGETNEFEFEHVPYPNRVSEFINDMLSEIKREKDERRG